MTQQEIFTRTSADHFNFDDLHKWCTYHESEVGEAIGAVQVMSPQHRAPENFYYFKDNGSDILAVAHLDTVVSHEQRTAGILYTAGGQVVYSGSLDDRLGAYVLADLLPAMGITFDLLLTVGEENGQSTAEVFEPTRHHDREYKWIIEFDRGGTDVVLYQFEDEDLRERVEATGARVEQGIFSDIAFMEHLGVKALNWGVGYRDYHSVRGHVWLDDLFKMVDHFLDFHETNKDTHLPHEAGTRGDRSGGFWGGYSVAGATYFGDDDDIAEWGGECEAEMWGVGDCEGPLSEDPALGTLCEKHEQWANT